VIIMLGCVQSVQMARTRSGIAPIAAKVHYLFLGCSAWTARARVWARDQFRGKPAMHRSRCYIMHAARTAAAPNPRINYLRASDCSEFLGAGLTSRSVRLAPSVENQPRLRRNTEEG